MNNKIFCLHLTSNKLVSFEFILNNFQIVFNEAMPVEKTKTSRFLVNYYMKTVCKSRSNTMHHQIRHTYTSHFDRCKIQLGRNTNTNM